ncbi:MAG: PQQ-binding-like beta-propeller repeat protein [Opitutales bacterium]
MQSSLGGVLVLASLLALPARAEDPAPAQPGASFEGAWAGSVIAPNDRTEINFTFTRGKHGLNASFSMPAMFVHDMNLGPAQIVDGTYSLPDLGIKLTLSGRLLTGTFANPLLRVELHRGAAHAPAQPAPDLPPGPPPVWSHSLGAETWASPVTRDGMVYVGSADGKFHAIRAADGTETWTWTGPHPLYGEALATEESLYFLDERTELISLRRADGQLQWRVPLHDEKLAGQPAPHNPTFNRRTAVPVLAEGTVYVGSSDHGLYALEAATGKILWRHDLGAPLFAAVALQGNDLVAGCYDGSVVVLNRHTGAESARTKLGGPVASAPVIAGDMIIVGCRDYLLYGLRRSDLGIAWRDSYWFSWVESVPQCQDGLIYIGGSDFRRVSAIDPATGRALWATDVRGLTWGTPVVTAGTVYAGTSAQNPAAIHHEGGLVALDRRTGAVQWRHVVPLPASAERAGYLGSLVLARGNIIGAGFDGTLIAYPAR